MSDDAGEGGLRLRNRLVSPDESINRGPEEVGPGTSKHSLRPPTSDGWCGGSRREGTVLNGLIQLALTTSDLIYFEN